MSTTSRFPKVRSLLAGMSLSSPPEDAEAGSGGGAAGGKSDGPSASDVEAAVALEIDTATKAATAAANDRWNKVMTSTAGAANPKGASRLLMMAGGVSTADEVIEALGDISAPAPDAAADQRNRNAADRNALNSDESVDPPTGAGGNAADRRGEGQEPSAAAQLKESRAARATARNANAQTRGGKKVGAGVAE